MPFVPTSPTAADVPTTESKVLDTYQITDFIIHLDHNNAAMNFVLIRWVEGAMDGETWLQCNAKERNITGAELATAMAQTNTALGVDGDATIYEDLKQASWQHLISVGEVPAGSIS